MTPGARAAGGGEPAPDRLESQDGSDADHRTSGGAVIVPPRSLEGEAALSGDGGEAFDPSRDLVAREYVIGRLGHLGRRLEELHQAELRRFSEERRETWILVFALSVVLVFCFAAFFMNQMEVRELRSGLEEELERRSAQTVSSIEDTIDALQLEKLPRFQVSLERLLRDKDTRDQRGFEGILEEVRRQGTAASQRIDDRIRALEERLEAVLRLTRELQLGGESTPAVTAAPASP